MAEARTYEAEATLATLTLWYEVMYDNRSCKHVCLSLRKYFGRMWNVSMAAVGRVVLTISLMTLMHHRI